MASTGQQQSSSSVRHHHSSSTVRQYEESGAMIDAEEDAGEPQLVQPLYPVSEWDKKLGRIDANDVSADIYDIVIFFLLSMLCAISSTGGYISLFFCFLQLLVAVGSLFLTKYSYLLLFRGGGASGVIRLFSE